jgi:hypothetical protein
MKRTIAIVALAIALTAASAAFATAPSTESISEPYGPFTQSCGSFEIEYSGTNENRITTYFDQDGNPIRIVAHKQLREIDRNTSSGKTLEVRGNVTIVLDLVSGTETYNGHLFLSNDPGAGVVIQDVGRITFNPDGSVVVRGPHEVFESQGAIFCDALG